MIKLVDVYDPTVIRFDIHENTIKSIQEDEACHREFLSVVHSFVHRPNTQEVRNELRSSLRGVLNKYCIPWQEGEL